MSQLRLTDEAIRRLPSAEAGTVFYSDTSLRGLQLAVGKRKRTFYVLRWFNGRNVRHKVGEWCPPMFTAGAARKAAEELVGNMVRGIDPRVRRHGTLQEWLDDYIRTYTHASHDRLSLETAEQYRAALKLYCNSWLSHDIAKITDEEIAAKHRKLIDKPTAANHLVRVIRSIQRHAGIAPRPKFAWFKQRRRENGVRPDNRADFGQMILSIDNKVRGAVWLLGCYTGIRRQNLCSLRWEQVDLDAATLHLPKMKNKHARTMPLSPQAVAVLRTMVDLSNEWVFPSLSGSRTGYISEVRDPAIPDSITFHDCRRVFTEAGGECLIAEYAIAYLRGDVVNQTMAQRYMSHLDLREPIKKIGKRVEGQLFPKAKAAKRKAAQPDLKLAA